MDYRSDATQERLRELAKRAGAGEPVFTKFLDPREQALAQAAASAARCRAVFYGGEAPLERRVAAFVGGWEEDPDVWPVVALRAQWNARYAQPAHRDFLGALLALGVSREALGDILVGEGHAWLFVLESMADFVRSNLTKAGNAALRLEQDDGTALANMAGQQVQTARVSIQSMRLDAVVAAAYDLSREQAAQAVRAGLVKLNFAQELRTDHAVEEGAMLSMKGMGRARVACCDGSTTRSGRLVVFIERYL